MLVTPQEASRHIRALCHAAPIVPALVVKDISHARLLVEALVAAGLPALAATLHIRLRLTRS